jgi:ABC-type sugar transport system substrate-binding protein
MTRAGSPVTALLGGCLLLAGIACDRGPDSGAGRAPSRRVALVGRGPSEPAWEIVRRLSGAVPPIVAGVAFEEALPAADTPEAQRETMRGVDVRHFAAVGVWVNDPDAILGQVSEWSARGTHVVLFGCDVPDSGRSMYCGPDNIEIGTALARACVEQMRGPSRTIGLLHAGGDDPAETARVAAFRRQLALSGSVEILREVDYGGHELEARGMLADEIARYPRMGGWVLMDDWPIRGARPEDSIVPAGAALVFYAPTGAMLSRVRLTPRCAAVCPDFERMFQRGMWAAGDLAKGARLQTSVDTIALLIITRESLAELERTWVPSSTAPARP